MTPIDDTRSFFDRQAERWDETNYPPRQLSRIGPLIAGLGLQPGWRILDVGCGTGVLIPFLLEAVGDRGSVVGLDISPGMIAAARAKGFGPRVSFVVAAVEEMPFDPERFEAAICFSAFPHFENHPAALREIGRVLVPEGMLALIHLEGSERISAFHNQCGGAIEHHHLPSGERMTRLLEACGFHLIEAVDHEDLYRILAVKSG